MAHFESRHIYEAIPNSPSAHASTVCQLADDRLMAAWYAGSAEGRDDVAVYAAYLRPDREEWGPPLVLEKTPGIPEGNPVLHALPDGRVMLVWATMYERRWIGCLIRVRESVTAGGQRKWGADRVFSTELGLMPRNKAIVMSNGELLLPLYDERVWASFFAWSDDLGTTWQRSECLRSEPGNIQPSAVEVAPGRLVAIARCGGKGGELWRSYSADYGRNWSVPEPTGIPNPNSGTDMVGLRDGRLALVYNDTRTGRTPLTVAVSEDEGTSFPIKRNLEWEAGEYSYPAIIQTRDGLLNITYTYRRETIQHVRLDPEWVYGG
jgi:predicted neuraminidase